MRNPWIAANESYWGNGWVVLDPDWFPRPLRHYCSSERVARRFACWKFRRWKATEIFRHRVAALRARG